MTTKIKKIGTFFFILLFSLASSLPITAETAPMQLTIEEAVKVGLENSMVLKQVRNQIDLSGVAQKRAKYLSKKLEDSDQAIHQGKEQVNDAKNALDHEILPQDVNLPDGTTIPKGTHLSQLPLPDDVKQQIKQGIEDAIHANEEKLNAGENLLNESLKEAGAKLGENLDFSSLDDSLSVDTTGDLMTTMTNVSFEVTKASYDIYKNQIAMLIQKKYYDVLKAQKILEVKKKAMERAQKQYEFTKTSYEEGMKAKDDMLLAKVYYQGTQIEYRSAQGAYNNSLIELKKNMNIPLDTSIVLTDVLAEKVEPQNLSEGLQSGLKNRLEMKKATGEVKVYDLNFESTKTKYPDNTFQYKEAYLLKEKARINYQTTKTEVDSSIRQSYETLTSTGEMLNISKEMITQAQESVEIANYKYQEGFGVDTSLLKKLDLESAAGTIVEVLAAEENLATVEEKVVQIMYGYNLSKMKYFNDIGQFIY